jgi:hypothetical protein
MHTFGIVEADKATFEIRNSKHEIRYNVQFRIPNVKTGVSLMILFCSFGFAVGFGFRYSAFVSYALRSKRC